MFWHLHTRRTVRVPTSTDSLSRTTSIHDRMLRDDVDLSTKRRAFRFDEDLP